MKLNFHWFTGTIGAIIGSALKAAGHTIVEDTEANAKTLWDQIKADFPTEIAAAKAAMHDLKDSGLSGGDRAVKVAGDLVAALPSLYKDIPGIKDVAVSGITQFFLSEISSFKDVTLAVIKAAEEAASEEIQEQAPALAPVAEPVVEKAADEANVAVEGAATTVADAVTHVAEEVTHTPGEPAEDEAATSPAPSDPSTQPTEPQTPVVSPDLGGIPTKPPVHNGDAVKTEVAPSEEATHVDSTAPAVEAPSQDAAPAPVVSDVTTPSATSPWTPPSPYNG